MSPCSKGWRPRRRRPDAFADASALAKAAGVSLTKLADLFRDHAHLAPAQWLRRLRVKRAAARIAGGRDKVAEIGFGAGFESESVFHRQFLAQMRMTPGAYRALDGAQVFMLQLPAGYRAKEILGYHARDPEGSQRTQRRQPHLEGAAHRGRSGGAGNQHRAGPGLGEGACRNKAGPRQPWRRCIGAALAACWR